MRWPSDDTCPELKRQTRGETESLAWAAQVKALLDDVQTMLERSDEDQRSGHFGDRGDARGVAPCLPSIEFPYGSPEEAEATLKRAILVAGTGRGATC